MAISSAALLVNINNISYTYSNNICQYYIYLKDMLEIKSQFFINEFLKKSILLNLKQDIKIKCLCGLVCPGKKCKVATCKYGKKIN